MLEDEKNEPGKVRTCFRCSLLILTPRKTVRKNDAISYVADGFFLMG